MTKKFKQAWDQVALSPEADARIRAVIETAQCKKNGNNMHLAQKTVRRFSRTAVIAAVLACLFAVTALAAGIHYIAFRTRPALLDGGECLEVFFEQTADGSVELGKWDIGVIPVGFDKVDNFRSSEINLDYWRNADGEEFIFSYELPSGADTIYGHSMYAPDRILEEGNVEVNGTAAWYLVYVNIEGNVHTNLYWTRPDAGVGFCLSTFDLSIEELIAIAESVAEQ